MAATLIRTLPLGSGSGSIDGKASQYMLDIEGTTHPYNTYVDMGPAVVNSSRFQVLLSLLVCSSSAVDLTFGLSGSINFPLKGLVGTHGMPLSRSIYIAGIDGYRIQVKASAACVLHYTICETNMVRL